MPDHTEINQFFEEILTTLFKIVPEHADVKFHVIALRASIENHAKLDDKYALELQPLTNTDLEKLVRFVERPGGRHHIGEVKKIWDQYGAEAAGRQLLKHFYEHNNTQLEHSEKLKHLK